MATIDDKVVAMSFESSKFESGVKSTLSSLDKLKAALHFPGAGKGLDEVSAAAKRIDLSHISDNVEKVKQNLQTLKLIAIGVFSRIAYDAVHAGTQLVKAFTLEPLKAGFAEYSTNLNSIQTILANTQASGATLGDVNAALLDLNHYSDKTIYNFSQMARNIGTFTAAGVDLKTSTASIKGIANLAALSGSNADQASTAMYQLSQAISAGKVGLQDWNSVVNAGMGGTVFQRALATTAENMGTLKKGTLKLVGPMKNVEINGRSFRQAITAKPGEQSWLTSKVLTTTLQQFTGDLKDSELAAQGFNAAQIKAIQQTAKTAQHAATEVKTIAQVLDVAKETAGSGWAQTWQIVFGNFNQAKKSFTELSNAVNGFINANSKARNKVLADWNKLGGRTELILGIKTAFESLSRILAPIKSAFRELFPATTGKQLFDLTVAFKNLMGNMRPSLETIGNLKNTFRGVFAIMDIGKQVIFGLFRMFKKLFESTSAGEGGFLSFTGGIGEWIFALDKALKKGDQIGKFFEGMASVIRVPLKALGKLKDFIVHLFDKFAPEVFSKKIDVGTQSISRLDYIIEHIESVWSKFVQAIKDGAKNLDFSKILDVINGFGKAVGNAASNINFDALLEVIRTGLFAGLVIMLKKFMGKGSAMDQLVGQGGGIVKKFSGILGGLEGSLKSLQLSIKADILKKIAQSVFMLAGAVVALSLVNPDKLKASLAAMTVAFGQLLGAMAVLTTVSKSKGLIMLPVISAAMIAFAAAVDTLAIAVIALSFLSWESLLKGLAGVGALMVGLVASAGPLGAAAPGLIKAGFGIGEVAAALVLMSTAVMIMGHMDLKQMVKGLAGITAALVIVVATMEEMPPSLPATGAGLIAVAFALNLMVRPISKLGALDGKTLGKGLLGIAGALGAIALAMNLMPPNMLITGAGLVAVSFALDKIAKSVMSMGGQSWQEIAKGITALGGALLVLAVGLELMSGGLAGAAALAVASVGIKLISEALIKMGKMSWGDILKGLITLAASLVILGLAAAALTPVIPEMLALGVALVLIGGGIALAGAGLFLLASGLSLLAVAGPTAIGVLISAIIQLEKALPEMVKELILGLLEIVDQLTKVAPKLVAAVIKIVTILLDAIIKLAPKLVPAITALVDAIVNTLNQNQDKIIQAGLGLLIALLKGIRNNIGQVTRLVIDIISNLLNSIAKNIHRITDAGANLIIALLKGITDNLIRVQTTVLLIIVKFVAAMMANQAKVVTAGLSILISFLGSITSGLNRVVAAGAHMIIKFVEGLGKNVINIIKAAGTVATRFVNALASESLKLARQGAIAIVRFLNGVAAIIDEYEPQIIKAFAKIGWAIVHGILKGIKDIGWQVADKVKGLGKDAIDAGLGVFGINSPSKEFHKIGTGIVEGLVNGLDADSDQAIKSVAAMSNGVIQAVQSIFQIKSPSRVMYELGKAVTQGFAQGIRGSAGDIQKAFAELNSKLLDAMKTSRATIISEQAKLNDLLKAKTLDAAAIKKSQDIIALNQSILAKSTAAHNLLTIELQKNKVVLQGLAKEYDNVHARLTAAKTKLDELIQARDQAVQGFTDQYGALPEIVTKDAEGNAIDQLATYEEALKHQADAITAYQSTLDQLRALGLDDETYKKLVEEGPQDQQFADQLLAGGKTAVEALNGLDAQLKKNATKLATTAAHELHDVGINAKKALIKGLGEEQNELRKQMEAIAREMIKAIKKELAQASPSKKFIEIGKYTMMGLAKGLADSSKLVTSAVVDVSKDALSAMQRSVRNISAAITEEINPEPVITPVLDLTQVQNRSAELANLTNVSPITAAASYGQASSISSEQLAAQAEQLAAGIGGTSISFVQTNTSPKALSDIEIYRQTKNQLSQLKALSATT